MKAIVCNNFGPIKDIEYKEVDEPNLNEDSIGPMSFAGEIANNLDAHLDKVVTGIIEN